MASTTVHAPLDTGLEVGTGRLVGTIADDLNRAYQEGFDAAALVRVTHGIADLLGQVYPAFDRKAYLDVASMSGLPVDSPPDLPPGVAFYQVSGFARTQEACDALTEQDGWVEGTRESSRWKKRRHHDGSIVVHDPVDSPGREVF